MPKLYKAARDRWIKRIFSAGIAKTGGIVYRSVHQVDEWASLKELKAEVIARGFHLLRIGDLYVIVCHDPANIKVIC
jgi:hypothetical protein